MANKIDLTFFHTPGPWQLLPDGDISFRVKSPDDAVIARVAWYPLAPNNIRSCIVAENAALITAAPDLLKACCEMFVCLRDTDFDVCGLSDENMDRWAKVIESAKVKLIL